MQRDALAEEFEDYPFEVRYEGGDAVSHRIEMSSLAESLDGFSRIYAMVGHFVSTGRYAKQSQALNVKTYAQATEAKCFSLQGAVDFMATGQVFSGFAGAVLTGVVAVVLGRSRNSKEEMKHLRELFERQMQYSKDQTDRVMDTVDRLADSLRPSVKKAVSPVGKTCRSIDIYENGRIHHTIDQSTKDSIESDEDVEITPLQEYWVVLTAFDRVSRTCKVHFVDGDAEDQEEDGTPRRIPSDINDPSMMLDNNPYLRALGSGKPVQVMAKAMMKDGMVSKLYISDLL
ncbi:hypothetical protein [Salinicola aestuarinus]|uniref:DUF7946 domain-containing protein n=1 Tax=Salinicola aestuarinus TaxID=1949082 RepID=UPI0013009903|nr:hypothetical protein [Salinicola aestuarinus]